MVLFRNVEQVLRLTGTNAIEYGVVVPHWRKIFGFQWLTNMFIKNSHSSTNPYGHAVIRYHKQNTYDKIMNINGTANNFVTFYHHPADYIYSSQSTPQGDPGQRSLISIRINNISNEHVDKLNDYYNNLHIKANEQQIKFQIYAPITNYIKKLLRNPATIEENNCAGWTSEGLKHIGMISEPTGFPNVLLFKLLINQFMKNSLENIEIISYRSINVDAPKGSLLYPFYWLKHSYKLIWNIDKYASIIVTPKKISESEYILCYETNPAAKEHWAHIVKKLKTIRRFKSEFKKMGDKIK